MRCFLSFWWTFGILTSFASAMPGASSSSLSTPPTVPATSKRTTNNAYGDKNIVLLHPDLGIGGAERLVIDAAVGLQSLGHSVTVFTSYCDPGHSFEETQDGTLDVRVRGDTLFPPAIGGRLSILFSILRQLSLILTTGVFTSELRRLDPDIFIVDQLSAGIPLLRFLFPKARILFYGHYPDQLLLREFGTGIMKPIRIVWRIPFDLIERWTTACADAIAVNSKFTRAVFRKTFPNLKNHELTVIYPCVDTENPALQAQPQPLWEDKKLLLSINRFECKKDLALAIKAYAGLSVNERSRSKLVLAGGFDPRSEENSECYDTIKKLTTSLHLTHATMRPHDTNVDDVIKKDADVFFLQSISGELKNRLLNSASLLIYTPTDEHFGIVPLEAMLAGVPVLATNTGGPVETVYDGRTGWLRSPNKTEAWTEVMKKVLLPSNEEMLAHMAEQGRHRVRTEFSRTNMTDAFNREVIKLSNRSLTRPHIAPAWIRFAFLAALIAIVFSILSMFLRSHLAIRLGLSRSTITSRHVWAKRCKALPTWIYTNFWKKGHGSSYTKKPNYGYPYT